MKVPLWLDIFFNIMLIAFALILIYMFFRRIQTVREARRRLAEANEAADAPDDVADDLLPEHLQRTAERGLARLAEGDPRNAIVRCWVMSGGHRRRGRAPPGPRPHVRGVHR